MTFKLCLSRWQNVINVSLYDIRHAKSVEIISAAENMCQETEERIYNLVIHTGYQLYAPRICLSESRVFFITL